ncbi:MAG: aminotransferase class V-fold PLP-dependent enzyme [Gemmatimonadetes bacterium]|uniref:Aminotransferase class V-fold PLP-dependent enzyme n=1 Tax=Candidatus Kutchimonas denitrificans TaxID=3056748 RepID=A0AAE5CDH1_9BACT|nr:aminotransferase class V-fold PLP-dependent enzyme [Gemmatimonadota bacterium]NIR75779.1 aminotransferase class V-fold PLP-dependent enzyme [Candidatus Kutchimonas denitrificans]NIT66042.1 aminotransferase class V-fold PLP-dependent enzyme [Gemmatimonadota bacterium]NIY34620.1 aminotransferase class V-fold PLP-dependent enzyme [Gemmatimonadota bacterium]NIY42857.1 aminotransferase class V-fold PLP-dependent enzyme [Gemmatimonadota bacterium]
MDRRRFVTTSVAGIMGAGAGAEASALTGAETWSGAQLQQDGPGRQSIRAQFPRLKDEIYLNAAGGTPLGAFAEEGIRKYLDYIRLGPGDGRRAYFDEVWTGVRGRFAALVGADESEIGLVGCTKAGEQIVIDRLEALRRGGNVVTNDMHFSGSLHNYEGLRRSGLDVRVVRARDFDVALDRMAEAMDDRTALVAVSLVSNVNGRIEPVAELSRLAHERGALLFADIIQAVGAIPVDLHAMGVDVAAASSYKWLFGTHGAGFLYVRDEVQGTALPDRIFPGHVRRNYAQWVEEPEPGVGDYRYSAPSGALRYQPGHVSYLGYAAVYEALGFLEQVGGAEAVQAHSTALVARLLDGIDTDAYRALTPDPGRSTILALQPASMDGLTDRLAAANVAISVGGDMDRMIRISPAIYNSEADIDRLVEVLNG